MSRTVGRIDFIVGLDGRSLPAQVRKVGEKAGAGGGKAAGVSFADAMKAELRTSLKGLTADVAKVFANKKGLDNYAKGFGSVGEAATALRKNLQGLSKYNIITDRELKTTMNRIEKWEGPANAAREATERLSGEFTTMWNEAKKMNKEFDSSNKAASVFAIEVDKAHAAALRLNSSLDQKQQRKEQVADLRDFRSEIRSLIKDQEDSSKAYAQNAVGIRKFKEEINRAHGEALRINATFDKTRVGFERQASVVDRLKQSLSGANEKSFDFFAIWKGLPNGFKRFSFYVGLFAALGESIAVLGSASGSSLAVLGTTLSAVGVGAGVLVAGFIGMTGELSKVAPAARPAAQALKEMGKGFSDIRQSIQGRLFANLEGPIRNLTAKLLPRLKVGFSDIAGTLNGFLSSVATALTGPASLTRLSKLLDGFGPILANFGGLLIGLGGSLARVFEGALPITQDFTKSLDGAIKGFNAFLDTEEGQKALLGFFQTLRDVAGPIGGLVGSVGKALADMVTPEAIDRFITTLGYLEDFAPALGNLMSALGTLDPIGLLAKFLKDLGDSLAPVLPDMERLNGALNENFGIILTGAATAIGKLAEAITPGLVAFVEELTPGLEALFGSIEDVDGETIDENADALRNFGRAISEFLVFGMSPDSAKPLNDLQQGLNTLGDTLRTLPFTVAVAGAVLRSELDRMFVEALLPFMLFKETVGGILAGIFFPVPVLVARIVEEFQTLPFRLVLIFGEIRSRFGEKMSELPNLIPGILGLIIARFFPLPAGLIGALASLNPRFSAALGALPGIAGGIVERIVAEFGKLPGRVSAAIDKIRSLANVALGAISGGTLQLPRTAVGGVFSGSQARIIAEAGPEAVVPLNRPLSQVNPDVRALSAFAQGLPFGGSNSTSSTDSRRQVTVASGAVTVISPYPQFAGTQVLDALVSNL